MRLLLAMLIVACPALCSADPVLLASMQGCVTPDELPSVISWVYAGHLRVVGLHEATAGCEPTTAAAHPRSYMDMDETADFTRVTFRLDTLAPSEWCGRLQLDVATSEAAEDVRPIVIDFGFNCGAAPLHASLVPTVTVPSEVPEPATLGLTLCGLAWLLRRRRAS